MSYPPLTDAVIVAIAQLIDDAQTDRRDPSHSELDFLVKTHQMSSGDPKAQGQTVGKAKRVRMILSWALENSQTNGSAFVAGLLGTVRGHGGFRDESSNFVGQEAIANCAAAFASEGWTLGSDGDLRPKVLDGISGAEMTDALLSYIRRAHHGAEDAALLAGTGKDLLEATAAHVIQEKFNVYDSVSNFPTLLGQAFVALGMKTSQDKQAPGEAANCRFERSMYQLACSINALRNKQGTGHGRPFLPTISVEDSHVAIQMMASISEYMLKRL